MVLYGQVKAVIIYFKSGLKKKVFEFKTHLCNIEGRCWMHLAATDTNIQNNVFLKVHLFQNLCIKMLST